MRHESHKSEKRRAREGARRAECPDAGDIFIVRARSFLINQTARSKKIDHPVLSAARAKGSPTSFRNLIPIIYTRAYKSLFTVSLNESGGRRSPIFMAEPYE